MKNRGFTFNYLLGWIMFGLATGFIILLWQGYEHLSVLGDHNSATPGETRPQTTAVRETGFAHAVSQASSSVVSIQAVRFVAAIPATPGNQLIERFLGKTHRTHRVSKPRTVQARESFSTQEATFSPTTTSSGRLKSSRSRSMMADRHRPSWWAMTRKPIWPC